MTRPPPRSTRTSTANGSKRSSQSIPAPDAAGVDCAPFMAHNAPKRVVSGMRPTGRLHLGHYHGAVKNWIEISRKAECFYFSADWHALTSEYKDTSGIREAQREMFADWVAAGLDPQRCPLFIHRHRQQ